MKRVLYIVLILLVASCSLSDPATLPEEQSAVSFETDYDWPVDSALLTRGYAKTGFTEGDAIGIFAYHIKEGESVEDLTPNFMYNQLTTLETNGTAYEWQYSPVKYWPNTTTDSLQFFAYYPYGSNDNTNSTGVEINITSSESDTGYPEISFRQSDDIAEQMDFMTAQTNALAKCDAVPLSFEHHLTQVSFAARQNGVSSDLIYVTEIELQFDQTKVDLMGAFTKDGFIPTSTDDYVKEDLNFMLTTDNGLLSSGYEYRIPLIEEDFYKKVNSQVGTLMLPPQDIASGSITIIVKFSIDRGWSDENNEPLIGEKTLQYTVDTPHEYIANTSVVYQLTLDLETSEVGMDIDNIVREVWNETGEDIGVQNEDNPGGGGVIW